ncbi:MAG: hypothetical protein J7L98_03685 [Candidatus Verstraetearchaeota archaeon]|nr:hypothetical protein [Candidatus Verstraetearchaeota archaeon]
MEYSNLFDLLLEALGMTLAEVAELVPKILISVIVAALFIVAAVLVTKVVRKILDTIKLDEIAGSMLSRWGLSISWIIVTLLNIGIALLALYTIVMIISPGLSEIVATAVNYISRIASVIFLMIFTFTVINAIVEKLKVESTIRGFLLLFAFFIALALIIDVTSLSTEVKSALTWGISLGIGLSMGVFAAWYFFGEQIAERLREREKRASKSSQA